MKVTALVTLSLTAVLLVLDFEPTCGIRLSDPYGEKHSVVESNGLPNPASLGGDATSASEHHHGNGINSGSSTSIHGGGISSAGNTDSANKLSNAENSARKHKVRSSSPRNLKQTESIEDLLEAGLWQMPVQLWNYLPHTNSINNHHANVQIVDHHHDGQLNHHRSGDNTESDEEDDDDRRGASRHHLSFIPDPDNSVSIHVPSNHAFLGQRLVGFNKPHFSDLTQVYVHPDEDDNPPGGGGGGHPTILKRTHSDNSPIGSRKTEDRKRANRPYDVPQIECPPADDGMERFACPSPDRQGRYRCIDDHVLCDGFLDCPEGEDEDRHACMFYKTTKAHLDVLADALLRWARGKR